jgi:glycosyltransferase 2 family protein
MPLFVLAAGFAGVALVGVGRGRPWAGRLARARSAVVSDIRNGVLRRNALPAIVLASTVAVLGYALTFLIAARTAGATASIPRLLPLAMLAMLAMVLPSVAGWGPKEGVTAWVFSAAGLGADRGAATAVVYGVMTLVAFLPGAIVLVTGWLLRRRAPVRAALL